MTGHAFLAGPAVFAVFYLSNRGWRLGFQNHEPGPHSHHWQALHFCPTEKEMETKRWSFAQSHGAVTWRGGRNLGLVRTKAPGLALFLASSSMVIILHDQIMRRGTSVPVQLVFFIIEATASQGVAFFFKFIYYLFIIIIFGCVGSSFLCEGFCSCGKRGPLFIAVRGPLTIAASLVAEHRLQTRRLSCCGSRA